MRLTELALRRAGAADLEEFQRREGLYPSGQEDILTMQRLTPLLLGYERYMVKPGDTYYRIATARGTSVRAMLTANPNQNPNLLIPGQYLNVPYGFPVVPTDVPFSSELLQICVQGLLVRYPFLSQKCIARTAWGRPVTAAAHSGRGRAVRSITPATMRTSGSQRRSCCSFWSSTPTPWRRRRRDPRHATHARCSGGRTTLWLVPMVNPDGVDLVTGAHPPGRASSIRAARAASRQAYPAIPLPGRLEGESERRTDLNLNYPAGLGAGAHKSKSALGFDRPRPAGLCRRPRRSTSRSRAAMAALTRAGAVRACHALLSQSGRGDLLEISGLCTGRRAGASASEFALVSGYAGCVDPAFQSSGFAGYKDWFLQDFRRPGYTIEAGLGTNPLPLSQFDEIYRRNIGILVDALP